MTTPARASSALTSRYATAFLDLAAEAGKTDRVEKDLKDLLAMLSGSEDFRKIAQSPTLSRNAQTKAVMALAERAGLDGLTKNFLGVLISNRRLAALTGVAQDALAQMAERRGEVTVKVETAQDLSAAQARSLQDVLAKGLQKKVSIAAKVEPSLLGGMIVTVGSKMIDDSVRSKLERLKAAMGKMANENSNESHKEVI